MIGPLALSVVLLAAGVVAPPWPLSPDGDRVAIPGDAPLEADGAIVEREGGGWWRVVPEAGRERVRLRSGGAVAELEVAPPPGTILVTADPSSPVKPRDAQVRIRLEVRSAGGAPLPLASPPVVVASTGTLGPPASTGAPGVFVASWRPSDSAQPEVLGIVALAPRCPLCPTPMALGAARIPVASAIDLPGTTDPGVETRVEIAGRVWGPVRADEEGHFEVPAVVPPGARWGLATSLNARGNAKQTRLDLHLPEGPDFVCLAWPERIPADGRAEAGVHCVAWAADGTPLDSAPLRATTATGALRVLAAGEAWLARYRAPRGGAGVDSLSLAWGAHSQGVRKLRIGLAPGAPASIDWETEGEPVLPGQEVRVRARALDDRGDLLGEAVAEDARIDRGRLRARGEFGDGVQRVALRFALPPGESAASLSLRKENDAWVATARDVAGRPVPGVELRFGGGERGGTDGRGEARGAARGETETVEGPSGLRAFGVAAAPAPIPPLSVSRIVGLALRPPGTFDVDASSREGWIRWAIRGPGGQVLPGRKVAVASDSVRLGPVEVAGDEGRCRIASGKGVVAVTDAESGATAIVEVR